MNEIANATMQTPIEIALGIDENGMTTARALYDFLEMPQKNFARWAKQNIENNEYYDENKDWWGFVIVKNGNECKDYRLTTDFAKHLSMESHCARGKIARQYFVSVEDKAKDMVLMLKEVADNPMKLLELHYKALKEVDGKVNALSDGLSTVRKDLEDFKNDMPILGVEESKITNAVKRKGVECLGGKESNAYNNRSVRGRLYSDLHNQLRREFGVSTYKAIKRNQADTAVSIIQCYVPPLVLSETIDTLNAQQTLEV